MNFNPGGAPAGSTSSLAALHGDDAVLKLIEVVKEEEVLWNFKEVPRDAESVRKLADAWDRVTKIMMALYPKADRTVLRTTWKSLRHRHRRRGFTSTGNYKWRDHMAFLNEIVEPLDEASTVLKTAKKRPSSASLLNSYVDEDFDDSDLPFTFSQTPKVGNWPKETKKARPSGSLQNQEDDYYETIIGSSSSSVSGRRIPCGTGSSVLSPMELLVAKVEAEDSSSDTSASGNAVEADIHVAAPVNDENNLLGSMDLTALASQWAHQENVGVDEDPTSITEMDQSYALPARFTRGVPKKLRIPDAMKRKLAHIWDEVDQMSKQSSSSIMSQQLAMSNLQSGKSSYAFGDLIHDRMQPLASSPARWKAEGLILTAVEKIVSELCSEDASTSSTRSPTAVAVEEPPSEESANENSSITISE
ncbi:hypothetical protein L596_007578 [Steinernema carpocapsae]|uniref:MADF domain-containing protein n=1 Tax=Steinernema carpocapsae TaxID=34508 RepID=A0A4U5P9X5_STECR|nr:hypothetical protein L596_007578 [Steinernema carpocapsae]